MHGNAITVSGGNLFLLAAVVLLRPAGQAAEDLVLSNKFGEVTAAIFIPGEVPALRGLYVHAANDTLKADDRWAEAGRAIGFGHLALDIDNHFLPARQQCGTD